jgi:hypothetical protein
MPWGERIATVAYAFTEVTRVARSRWVMREAVLRLLLGALVLCLAGCGGSAASHATSSSSSQSSTAPAAPRPVALPATAVHRLVRICRGAETSEDANIILSFGNKGGSILGQPEANAMRVAARPIESAGDRVAQRCVVDVAPDSEKADQDAHQRPPVRRA